jgi:hypothetical protein
MSATRYRHVALRSWACLSAAGGAEAAWAAVATGRSALVRDERGHWRGRLPAHHGDPVGVLHTAASAVWPTVASLPGALALGLSASKGDPWALSQALAGTPSAWLQAGAEAPNARIARQLGTGPYLPCAVAAACSTGLYALLAAADLIERGQAGRALAGAVDGDLPPWLAAGFAALGVLCAGEPPQAFAQPTGFAPAAGAGVLGLGADGPWRLVAGIRLGDAGHETHFVDPKTLEYALRALAEAAPGPELIITHGTGTAAGDAYELAGLAAGPWRSAERIAMKPLIGHCLGASGAVELAIACAAPVRRLWKLSLGFGGHLAAVALERA